MRIARIMTYSRYSLLPEADSPSALYSRRSEGRLQRPHYDNTGLLRRSAGRWLSELMRAKSEGSTAISISRLQFRRHRRPWRTPSRRPQHSSVHLTPPPPPRSPLTPWGSCRSAAEAEGAPVSLMPPLSTKHPPCIATLPTPPRTLAYSGPVVVGRGEALRAPRKHDDAVHHRKYLRFAYSQRAKSEASTAISISRLEFRRHRRPWRTPSAARSFLHVVPPGSLAIASGRRGLSQNVLEG